MKVLLTGATGYIGARTLVALQAMGHEVVVLVRDRRRFRSAEGVEVVEGDLLRAETLGTIPEEIDAAYYFVHSMGGKSAQFHELEERCARNFCEALSKTRAKQVVYLSGLAGDDAISEHMSSRHNVEAVLREGGVPVTVLQASIIIGSGSASFEIMRDLVEKLPVMVAPKWVLSKAQPIAIADVLYYLTHVLGEERCFDKTYQIGGPDVLNYREMLLKFSKIRGLFRLIIPIPVLTPYLSSLWLFLVTSVNFALGRALVASLKTDSVVTDHAIDQVLPHDCLGFQAAIERAFERIEQNAVISSWRDAVNVQDAGLERYGIVEAPKYGCIRKVCCQTFATPRERVIDKLWRIGGENGWYTMDWAWKMRGDLDQLFGGKGLRRGRMHPTELHAGDALDFWRVLRADREEGHLLLYAEMKLPGEAWLEWKIEGDEKETRIEQVATYRPKGVWGRLYWYLFAPAHLFIFPGMCRAIGKGD